jgi:hypothetical protein
MVSQQQQQHSAGASVAVQGQGQNLAAAGIVHPNALVQDHGIMHVDGCCSDMQPSEKVQPASANK